MSYTVAEVAELTELSKVSIYNKLKLKEFKPYVSKRKNITYIDDTGLKMIKDSLNADINDFKGFNDINIDNTINDYIEPLEGVLNIKDDFINYLKEENERLWNELEEKNNQINTLNKLIENSQILLKDKENKQDLLQLEEHFIELDNKLSDLRENLKTTKKENNIFKRLFK